MTAYALRGKLTQVIVLSVSILSFLTAACSGGGGDDSPPPPPSPIAISGGGVKGPLANAVVTVYAFNASQPGFKGAVIDTASTDNRAAITGLALPVPLAPPYVMEITSTPGTTTDITTGQFPIISSLRTVITQSLLNSGKQIYATPLTTMATDIAILNADSVASPYSGNGDATTTALELTNALPVAAAQVVSTLGFSTSDRVDIFDTPPLIDSTTITTDEQTAVAEYRTAVEALTALMFELGQNIATPAVSTETMLNEITLDLADGNIDGNINGSASSIVNATVLTTLTTTDPAALPIPGSDNGSGTPLLVDEVETLLVTEKNTTGSTTDTSSMATIIVTPQPAKLTPDADSDTIPDSMDNCRFIANQNQADSNNNGVGDGCDSAPVAVADNITVNEGATQTLLDGGANSVLNNDSDAENDALTATLISNVSNGSLTFNTNGTFSYVHDDSETSSDSFTYRVNDGTSDSGTVTVSISIIAQNDAPLAVAESATVNEGETVTVLDGGAGSVLNNDTDAENDSLTAVLDSNVSHGSLTLNENGTFSYAHNDSETITDSFTYHANDGSSNSNIVTVTITINPQNDAPIAVSDNAAAGSGGTVSALTSGASSVLSNDSDVDSSVLTAVLVTPPVNAANFILNSNGSFSYTHDGSATTSDNFSYQANDGLANSNTVQVSITISDNASPTATTDAITVDEGETVNVLTGGSGSVLNNDSDPESDPLTAILDNDVSNGSLTFNSNGTFSYSHNGSETISDSFSYHAFDGTSNSNTVSVTITINPLNDEPVAVADNAFVANGGTVTTLNGGATSVLQNDSDVDGPNALIATIVSGPTHAANFNLNSDGSFNYSHDGSATSTDSFSYQATDGADNSNVVTVTITIASAGNVDISGVWIISTTVVSESSSGCAGGIGETDQSIITIKQTGNDLTVNTIDGATLTGTIDTTSGEFNLPNSSFNGISADLSQPQDDTAFNTWQDNITATGSGVTATSLSVTATTVEIDNGSTGCTFSENISGAFVYKHTGTENYNGVYAFELYEEEENSDGTFDNPQDGFPLEIEITGSDIAFYFSDEGPARVNDRFNISNASFDPATGFFALVIDEVERHDFAPADGTIDQSETRHFEMSGIFMRDPAINNGVDGSPLIVWADHGYTRFYTNDVDSGGTPFAAQNSEAYAYGKRLTTQAMTRTIMIDNNNQADEARIMVGLTNPPLKRVNFTNSTLYIEVLRGNTILCSTPYIFDAVDNGRYFEHSIQPAPNFGALIFRGDVYSSVNCNTSIAGVDQISDAETLTVRVLDSGANGIKETTSSSLAGDDVITFSTSYAVEIVATGERFNTAPEVFELDINGAHTSTTLGGSDLPLYGFFNPEQAITVSWPTVTGANKYQLRAQEGMGADDYRIAHYLTTGTSITIPAGDFEDQHSLQLVAVNDTTSNNALAMAVSRSANLTPGIRGLFNIELGNALPVTHQTLQMWIEGNEFFAFCYSGGIWPANCIGASVNYANNTVTLTMTDDAVGTYTGAAGGSFNLELHFTASSSEAVITSANNIAGIPVVTGGTSTAAAKVANAEFYMRTQRQSHNAVERTRLTVANPLALSYTWAELSRQDSATFGDGSTTSVVLWDNTTPLTYQKVVTEFISTPTNDGNAQKTKQMATFATNELGFNNITLATGIYRVDMVDPFNLLPDEVFRYNYLAPDASLYIAPSHTGMTLDGTDCSTSICNDNTTPITVSATPDLSWGVDAAIPAGSYWRIQFRPTDAAGTVNERIGQIRTPFMQSGDSGLNIIGSTATWTNPGSLVLPSGTYEVRINVLDNNSGLSSTVLGSSSGSGGTGGDLTYITVP